MIVKRYFFFLLLGVTTHMASAQFKLYEKGHDSYTSGKYADAITNFSEYLTKPTRDKALDVEVFYLRALAYYKTNNYKSAIDDFQETILLDHQNRGNIYWFMAKAYDKTASMKECVNAYTYALRDLQSNKESRGKLLFERSQIHTKMGNLPLAYTDLLSLTVLQPNNAEAKRELEKLQKQGITAAVTPPPTTASNTQPQQGNPTTTRRTDTSKPEPSKPDATKKDTPADKNVVVARNEAKKDEAKKEDKTAKEVKTPVTEPPAQTNIESAVAVANSIAEYYKDEKRYALVIGNSNYPKKIGVLKNPVNDASDFAKELENSHFEVELLTNATYGQMRAAMLRFKEKVDAGERDKTVSLFYYAGHGLQRDDENYLVPIDAEIEFEDDIARYCFPVQRMVLSNMERSNSRMNIVILDACRNNPFPSINRGVEMGLGEMRRARGSFIAYATAPGSVASDGVGRNGLYTQELLKAVRKPGLTIEQVFKDVRQSVLRLSANKQNTWDSSNIIGEFYFKYQ